MVFSGCSQDGEPQAYFFFELAIKQQEAAWLLSKKVSDDCENMWNSVKYLNQVLIKPKMKCVQEKEFIFSVV